MTAKPQCRMCKKAKKGRYTRHRTRKDAVPYYYCYECAAEGEGMDETQPEPQPFTPSAGLPSSQLVTYRKQGAELLTDAPLNYPAIVDKASYGLADAALGKLLAAQKTWASIWDVIHTRSVKPLNEALEGLHSINREINGPLEKAIKALKADMKGYKVEEARLIEEDRQREQRAEQARIAEATRLQQVLETATSQKVIVAASSKLDQISEQQIAALSKPIAAPVQGAFSSTRNVKVPRVTDAGEFIRGVEAGAVPEELWAVIETWLAQQFRKDPDVVMAMPGVEIKLEPQIVGGR